MKKILALLTILTLVGCQEVEQLYLPMPEELKDCKVFSIPKGNLNSPLNVVVCPKMQCSSTSYKTGKTTKYNAYCE